MKTAAATRYLSDRLDREDGSRLASAMYYARRSDPQRAGKCIEAAYAALGAEAPSVEATRGDTGLAFYFGLHPIQIAYAQVVPHLDEHARARSPGCTWCEIDLDD